ncbi:hypothetical protein C8N25_111136 [Algoriphagus antarcticus]|uniref:Uncharacterized protein n=1 Tax=Algoriphagus antarcticus TaxID=238540 RepID=A0A3E0DUC7_9BACT|nr:hypothetical protein [Algoriphagus antarcticus]REG87157.1 hypothetical protein C8N25_111136 [Algoriphagus antarcticus]
MGIESEIYCGPRTNKPKKWEPDASFFAKKSKYHYFFSPSKPFRKGFFIAWAQLRQPKQNQESEWGWVGGKACLWRAAFGKPLDAYHTLLLTTGTVSRIVDFQNSRFWFRKQYSKFPMNERNRNTLGRASQYPEMTDSHQSFGQNMHGKPADKLKPLFEQMCGVGVPERVHAHRLANACLFLGFVDCPLHSTLGISGVKISAYTANDLLVFAVEYPFIGLFCF